MEEERAIQREATEAKETISQLHWRKTLGGRQGAKGVVGWVGGFYEKERLLRNMHEEA